MAKQKGLGTKVLYRKVAQCDLSIANATYADSAAAFAAFTAAGFKEFGCVFSIEPPGRSFETIEDEPCLNDSTVPRFDPLEIYIVGSVVMSGKVCYRSLGATTLNADETINTQVPAPPTDGNSNADWEVTDCGCAYPNTDLGPQEADNMAISNSYCPGDLETDDFDADCGGLFQFIYVYPTRVVNDGGLVCRTCAHTFCSKIQEWDPDEVTPTEFMKVSMNLLRTSEYKKFCFDDPV